MLRLALAAFAAFASTNVDDLFVLVVLFGAGRRARDVVAGQYAGFAAIVAASLAVSAGALLFRPDWVGFLGIAPFAIGVKALVARRAERGKRVSGAAIGVWGIAAVTLANGGDDVAVYVPLFARRASLEIAAMLVVFAVMVAVWCAAAHSLVRAPPIARALERWGHWIAPIVLVALGVYVFVAEGTAAYLLGAR